ncbi:MAG: vWA domain-containing protein [Deltaproteobacteria bacterium]
MNQNLTHVAFILDASGSMAQLRADTIGSFNRMLADQRAVQRPDAKVEVTLVTFNDEHRTVFAGRDIGHVHDLDNSTYQPDGNTALLDAVGTTIDALGERFAAQPEDQRPSKVLVVIVTDGEENASRHFNADQVRARIQRQERDYGWNIVFIGANIDVEKESMALGLRPGASGAYSPTPACTRSVFAFASQVITGVSTGRSGKRVDVSDYSAVNDLLTAVKPPSKTN